MVIPPCALTDLCMYCYISSRVAGSCYNFAVVKVDEHTKLCLSSLTKVYSLLHFLSSCWEKKKIEYENWAAYVSRTKRNMSRGERANTDLYLLSVFSCSSNMLVCWFHFHRFTELTPKWGPQLSTIFTLSCQLFTRVLTSSHLRAN